MLGGPAGTGKSLVALQVANNLMEQTREEKCSHPSLGCNCPLLVVTTHGESEKDPIMKYLDASTETHVNKLFRGFDDLRDAVKNVLADFFR